MIVFFTLCAFFNLYLICLVSLLLSGWFLKNIQIPIINYLYIQFDIPVKYSLLTTNYYESNPITNEFYTNSNTHVNTQTYLSFNDVMQLSQFNQTTNNEQTQTDNNTNTEYTQTLSDNTTETQPENTTEVQTENTTEVQSENTTQAQPENTTETQPENTTEAQMDNTNTEVQMENTNTEVQMENTNTELIFNMNNSIIQEVKKRELYDVKKLRRYLYNNKISNDDTEDEMEDGQVLRKRRKSITNNESKRLMDESLE